MDLIFEFFSFLINAVFWYFIISFIIGIFLRRHQNKEFDKNISIVIDKVNDMLHRVNIEKQDNIYYWWDKDDGSFLGQGKDTEEIIIVLQKRFPKHIFFLELEEKKYKLHGPDWKFTPIQ